LFGFTGLRCGNKKTTSGIKYDGTAYSYYQSNVPMATSAQLVLSVRLENENGILYFFSEYDNGTGDYFIAQFVNSIFELSISEGGSTTNIKYVIIHSYIHMQTHIHTRIHTHKHNTHSSLIAI